MKLTANITLDELTKSQVAERKGINNNPNPAQIENLSLSFNATYIATQSKVKATIVFHGIEGSTTKFSINHLFQSTIT